MPPNRFHLEDLAEHPVHLLTEPAALADAAREWATVPALALDTEFERTTTYYARPGLIQLFDGEAIWLVDPIEIKNLEPLLALCTAPAPIKIIHSASEDVDLLTRLCGGRRLAGVFDSQIAAGLAGLGAAVSYQSLVQTVTGIELEKSQTRSDWLRRPLSDAQLHYAALDVAYLLEAHQWLLGRLAPAGRLGWVEQDSERLLDAAVAGPDLDRMYREFKLAWKLDDPGRAALRALLGWREQHAAQRDIPRRRALDDDAVLSLAQQRPETVEEVVAAARLGRRKAGDIARSLIDLLAKAAGHDTPPRPLPPLGKAERDRLKTMKKVVDEAAARLGIEASLLASRRDLVALLTGNALPERLTGWRRTEVGEPLLEALAATA